MNEFTLEEHDEDSLQFQINRLKALPRWKPELATELLRMAAESKLAAPVIRDAINEVLAYWEVAPLPVEWLRLLDKRKPVPKQESMPKPVVCSNFSDNLMSDFHARHDAFLEREKEKNTKVRQFLNIQNFAHVTLEQRTWAEMQLGYPVSEENRQAAVSWFAGLPTGADPRQVPKRQNGGLVLNL